MSSWPFVALGDLCSIELGATPPRGSSRFWDPEKSTGNVWLSIADLPAPPQTVVSDSKEYLSDEGAARGKIVKEGTLLVSFKLTLGRLAYAGCDLRTNEAIAALSIRDAERIKKEYLYWYLTYFDWQKAAEGEDKVKGKTLNKEKLKVLPVLVPPLHEQRRIVAVLDEAFAAIATATANAEKNLINARAVIQTLSENLFGGLDADRLNVPLGKVCKLVNGRAYAKHELLKEGQTPVLRVGNFFTNPNWYYSNLKLDDDKYADDGDLLYAWSASFGPRIWNGGRVIYHYHIWKMLPDETSLDKRYLFHFLEWDKERIKAAQGAGATMIHVTKASMEDRLLPLASCREQRRIADKLDRATEDVQEFVSLQERKIDALESLRQSLLHRAFSGELTKRELLAA